MARVTADSAPSSIKDVASSVRVPLGGWTLSPVGAGRYLCVLGEEGRVSRGCAWPAWGSPGAFPQKQERGEALCGGYWPLTRLPFLTSPQTVFPTQNHFGSLCQIPTKTSVPLITFPPTGESSSSPKRNNEPLPPAPPELCPWQV